MTFFEQEATRQHALQTFGFTPDFHLLDYSMEWLMGYCRELEDPNCFPSEAPIKLISHLSEIDEFLHYTHTDVDIGPEAENDAATRLHSYVSYVVSLFWALYNLV